MKALITGGSSGIGKALAIELSKQGYDLFLVARDKNKLESTIKETKGKVNIISKDLSNVENCKNLYEEIKNENIDILINCAGIGLHGKFVEDNLEKQLELIDLNIKSVQTLTRLFLPDFLKRNSGYILNIASTAAFSPGPLMATYFASKAYILHLTEAIHEEIKKDNSKVYIGCLCPGPVNTHFNDNLGIKFKKAQESDVLAKYAIKKMFKKKMTIIPTINHKVNTFFNKIIPKKILLDANYNVQTKKIKNAKKE